MKIEDVNLYAPDITWEKWSERDLFLLEPFATGLDGSVHVLRNLPPEIAGALSSRASRASESLLRVLLKEYFYPILEGENCELARELEETVTFLREHGFKNILNNQRAQAFYAKWLSQYGDDSIAQMTGTHLLFDGISQVAIKFIEDQRIGLEPIEKSTRYVNFGNKVNGRYLYYIPKPDLERLRLLGEYRETLDNLFDVYAALLPRLKEWLIANYEDKASILEKKAFDTLRGLLPLATLGQVVFRGNAQAFEYLINRAAKHNLGELRWIASAAKRELDQEIPSLLLRLTEEKSKEYQEYLAKRNLMVRQFLAKFKGELNFITSTPRVEVRLIEYDPEAVEKIIAGVIFVVTHTSWEKAFDIARSLSDDERREILGFYIAGRKERWYKVGKAFENSYLRFEIVMNIGAYRDLQRHRMMTQERQLFTTRHGYDIPKEIEEAGLVDEFVDALQRVNLLYSLLENDNPELAQYVVPLAYRVRFYQWQNFRELFWETELRTTSQGHPDYRLIEQEKYRLIKEKFPQIADLMRVDMKEYAIARRGTEERILNKEQEIVEKLKKKTAER